MKRKTGKIWRTNIFGRIASKDKRGKTSERVVLGLRTMKTQGNCEDCWKQQKRKGTHNEIKKNQNRQTAQRSGARPRLSPFYLSLNFVLYFNELCCVSARRSKKQLIVFVSFFLSLADSAIRLLPAIWKRRKYFEIWIRAHIGSHAHTYAHAHLNPLPSTRMLVWVGGWGWVGNWTTPPIHPPHERTLACMHGRAHVRTHTHLWVYTTVYANTCECTRTQSHTCIHAHMKTHAHAHKHSLACQLAHA